MHAPDPPLPPVFSRGEARAAGLSDRQISWRASSGEWQTVGRGLFVVSAGPAVADDDVVVGAAARAGAGNRGPRAAPTGGAAARTARPAPGGRARAARTRLPGEGTPVSAEHTRVPAGHTGGSAEHTPLSAEHTPLSAEHTRVSAEHTRVSAEHTRVSAEHTRVSAEHTRVCAEHTPLSAEHARLLASLRATGRDVAVGLAHAARLYGLPRPLGGWGPPVLVASSGSNRGRSGYRITVTPLADDEVCCVDGLPVTSVLRTVTDCLRLLPPPDALAIADAAARRLVAASRIVEAVDRSTGWPGVVQARRLAAIVDGRRDGTLESWSALAFDTFDVPMPVWQVDVRDDAGFVGRVDGFWGCGVVGESDGRAKYRLRAAERGGVTGEQLARILDEERLRERRLRRAGLSVVRWEPKDVLDPRSAAALADHLRRELAARTTMTYTALTRPHPIPLPS